MSVTPISPESDPAGSYQTRLRLRLELASDAIVAAANTPQATPTANRAAAELPFFFKDG